MATATDLRRYMPYAEMAVYSGVSHMTLRRWVEAGRLRAYRPEGTRRVLLDRLEVDALIRGEVRQAEAAAQ
jgi:excisionase family DNA binding protein